MEKITTKALFTAEDLEKRLDSLGAEINASYTDGQPVVLICVLKGAFMFFSDLVKRLDMNPEVDFVRVASYGAKTKSSRNVSFTKDIEISIEDKHVILVDDIVDTGHTMAFLLKQFEARKALSLKVSALIDKRERREIDVDVDFPGFLHNEGFLIGYGLDYAEKYRTLPAIYDADFL